MEERLKLEDGGAESDEEQEGSAKLGFVKEVGEPWNLQRQHFPSKAGGAPAWLDPDNVPDMSQACCGICEEPLQFLLQIYAPWERDDTFHRTLYIFMCPKMACLRADQAEQKNSSSQKPRRSVKVFRSQLPRENRFYAYEPPTEKDLPLTNEVRLCNWCRTWRGEKRCGGCRNVWYCSRAHQIEHWHSGHKSSCKSQAAVSSDEGNRRRLWREFEIDMEREEDADNDGEGQQMVPANQEPVGRELEELEGFEEAPLEQQFWAAFQARIQRAPNQVLRCDSKKPLWMRLDGQPEKNDILPCHLCGQPRGFEFQVLSQLLYYFGVENEVDSLDWGTIAVYTCSDSCPIEGYEEEYAWIQLFS